MATEQLLLTKLLSGEKLSDADKKWLADYLEQGHTGALRTLLEQQFRHDVGAGTRIGSGQSNLLWQQIAQRAKLTPTSAQPAKRRTLLVRPMWWAAAAVVLALCIGAYLWQVKLPAAGNKGTDMAQQITPGHDGAVLTLADGSKVQLDTLQNNAVVALQGGAAARVVNGSLVYEGKSDQPVYNTVSTSKGRQFRLTLSDGTKVWLNSTSSIRYPINFNSIEKIRGVEVTGEVYFEVAGLPAKPFMVNVNQQAGITVLGTSFNVNAYDNEAHIATTVLEGSVVVCNNMLKNVKVGSIGGIVMKPRQQVWMLRPALPPVQASDTTGYRVWKQVDVEKVVAWKNGLFNFENATLAEIMRQLERWYDIEVVYETTVPHIALKGEITRDVPLSDLLAALKKMGLHFRLEERKLIVMH